MKRLNRKPEPMPSLVDLYNEHFFRESSESIKNIKLPNRVHSFGARSSDEDLYLLYYLVTPSKHHLLDTLTFRSISIEEDDLKALERHVKIKEIILPDNLIIRENAWIKTKRLKRLPDNLTVKGALNIYGSKVKDIPKNLKIGEQFLIGKSPLSTWSSVENINNEIFRKGGTIGDRAIKVAYGGYNNAIPSVVSGYYDRDNSGWAKGYVKN